MKTEEKMRLEAKFNEKYHFIQRDDYDYAFKLFSEGASEQQAIDIEKACEYWRNVFDQDDYGLGVHTEKAIVRFRKAMEE